MPLAPADAKQMTSDDLCRVLAKPAWSDAAKKQAVATLTTRSEDCRKYILDNPDDTAAIQATKLPPVCALMGGFFVCR